jgi:hypothetical protein
MMMMYAAGQLSVALVCHGLVCHGPRVPWPSCAMALVCHGTRTRHPSAAAGTVGSK